MVKINKIYTKTGDGGETHLVGGERVSKSSDRVEAYGEVDELNSCLGIVRTKLEKDGLKSQAEQLRLIQNRLFDVGAQLASQAALKREDELAVNEDDAQKLEDWIDALCKDLPELRSFVIPGGTELNSFCHLARAVCRRCERRVVALAEQQTINQNIPIYLNRLSDYLFALARFSSAFAEQGEYLWSPGSK
jgi:cob(I)alamin adenosyltransferase